MNLETMKNAILSGRTCMGMEFGSTRIKAVLIDEETHTVLASGSVSWENRLENGVWTYDLSDAVLNMQRCFADLCRNVSDTYGVPIKTIGCIGISGMMHGLLALDENDRLVTPFRTWRNTMTASEAKELSEWFDYTIPQRWSIAHLYQLMKTEPENARRIRYVTTLAGYIHRLLTGEHTLGCCEAAGMFPVDGKPDTPDARPVYFPHMAEITDRLAAQAGMPWKTTDIFPSILRAGENAGYLTAGGARLIDPTGTLSAGIPFCPPEGDGGTGMVCTNSLTPGDASVSAGTSTFGLFVLESPLSHANPNVEATVTPWGTPVAEIHSNNGTSELDAWVGIIAEAMTASGAQCEKEAVYHALLSAAMQADGTPDGIIAYHYLSGEHLTGFSAGRPLYMRKSDSSLNLANFIRAQLFAIFAPLAIGFGLLRGEGGSIRSIRAHGGLFRTPDAAQPVLAAALGAPVSVSTEAGEGGPFGAALLAAYAKNRCAGESLAVYLDTRVFDDRCVGTVLPDDALSRAFSAYLEAYQKCLPVERAAVEQF